MALGDNYIRSYEAVAGRELSELTPVQLVGYYCKLFPNCMPEKLLDDINNRYVPYTLGMRIKPVLDSITYGGIDT